MKSQCTKFPGDITQASIMELGEYLRALQLDILAAVIESNIIDGVIFSELEKDDFVQEPFNLEESQLIKVMKFIKGWRPKQYLIITFTFHNCNA